MDNAIDFVDVFTQPALDDFSLGLLAQEAEDKRMVRTPCLALYAHYLGHCQQFGLEYCNKQDFLDAVAHVRGIYPGVPEIHLGQVMRFFYGMRYIGTQMSRLDLYRDPIAVALLSELSDLDVDMTKYRAAKPRTEKAR